MTEYICLKCGKKVKAVLCDSQNLGDYHRVKCVCGAKGSSEQIKGDGYQIEGFKKCSGT